MDFLLGGSQINTNESIFADESSEGSRDGEF